MRFIDKRFPLRSEKIVTYFAWLPVSIKGETRWLEFVTIRGYYFYGEVSGTIVFSKNEFI